MNAFSSSRCKTSVFPHGMTIWARKKVETTFIRNSRLSHVLLIFIQTPAFCDPMENCFYDGFSIHEDRDISIELQIMTE